MFGRPRHFGKPYLYSTSMRKCYISRAFVSSQAVLSMKRMHFIPMFMHLLVGWGF
ncbi:hypothetical protein I7I48_01863 [Histoplasma ohiense]|nr:hypothetical protein I7I48_01863 [Histoplasma ohiense (nom. inval.)]